MIINVTSSMRGRLAIAAVLALLVVVALFAATRGDSAHATGAAADQTSSDYSVLKQPATSEATRLAETSPGIKQLATVPELAADPSGTRLIKTATGKSFAVVPAAVAPCLVGEDNSASCATSAAPVTVQVRHGYAVGLAPDSVKAVSLTLTDGKTTSAPVVNNVWEAPANAKSATVTIDGRDRSIDLMPEGSLPDSATVSPDGVVEIGHKS